MPVHNLLPPSQEHKHTGQLWRRRLKQTPMTDTARYSAFGVCSPAPHTWPFGTVMSAGEVGRDITGLCQGTRPDRRLFLRSGTSNGFRSARMLVLCRRPNFGAETTEPQTLLLFSPLTQWEPLTSSTHEADVVDGGTPRLPPPGPG